MKRHLRLRDYFRRYAACYVAALAATGLSAALDLLCPLITRSIVNDVIVAGRMERLTGLLLGFLWIGAGRCVLQYAKEFLCDYAGSRIGCEIRCGIFGKLQSLSASFYDRHNPGELMARVRDDVDRIWDCFAYVGILIAEVVIRTAIALYCMFSISWRLAVVPALCMLAAAAIAVRMDKRLDAVFGRIAEENSLLNNTAQENLSAVRTVKAFSREEFEIGKFRSRNRRYCGLNIDQSKVFVRYNPVLQAITCLLPCFVLLTGGILTIREGFSIGDLTALVQYAMNIVWPMEMLGWLANGLSSAKASARRLNRIYDETPDIVSPADGGAEKPEPARRIRGDISFERVGYRTLSGRDILKDVSFSIKAGGTLGIMGASGSGKTTLVNLLQRMYDVTDGSIKLDGTDVRHIALGVLRKSIACVGQDVFLFSDTIAGNVRLGARDGISAGSVWSALKKASAGGFVERLRDRHDTVIGERGVGLSGGQKQRITIARALARDTPVLVLDDSTSALDTETEREIQATLRGLGGMTKIIVSHRVSAVRNADRIIVLDRGVVAESGTHDELVGMRGLYYETYKSQY